MKKVVALLLALIMLFSLTAQTFAIVEGERETNLSQFTEGTGYVAFGDSLTRGYGATEDWAQIYSMDNLTNASATDCRNVDGSYPYLVAQRLGCNCPKNITDTAAEYWPIAQDAVTTSYVLDLLGVEDDFEDNEFLYNNGVSGMVTRYNTLLHYFGDEKCIRMPIIHNPLASCTSMNIHDLVAGSSLITIAVGMGDVWNRARTLATVGGMPDLSNPEALVGAITKLVARMYEGYNLWKNNFPKILKYFQDYAPNATVVIVGSINPAFNMNISDDYLYPVGSALSVITALMNRQYKQWAEEYGYIYVDISNVETGSTENQIGLMEFLAMSDNHDQGKATHPTPTGYQQIANLIIDALEEHVSGREKVKTDIKVDLGRITNLTRVCVNGISTTRYELNNGVLTIPYKTPFAKSLIVIDDSSEEKVAMTTYQLVYDQDDGYAAYRIYTTDDIGGVIKSAEDNVNSIVSKVSSMVNDVISPEMKNAIQQAATTVGKVVEAGRKVARGVTTVAVVGGVTYLGVSAVRHMVDKYQAANSQSEIAVSINTVSDAQQWLNDNYDAGLTVDGGYGNMTKQAIVKALQKELGFTGADVDGVAGSKTLSALPELKNSSQGNTVVLLQCLLLGGGYGNDVEQAVLALQKAQGMPQTGVCDSEVWKILLG